MGCPKGELSILIVDDAQIAELNQQYLKRQGPTNVLAFPMNRDPFSMDMPPLLGDVVISAETAEKEGKSAGITLDERLTQLLIHGILHLFDYDHEKDTNEAKKMTDKSDELLTLLKEKTPDLT